MKDIQQLIKKNSQEGRYEDIFPKTFIDAVKERETGMSLSDILTGFNMYFLPYTGNRNTTRLQVPEFLRRTGLIITYVTYDNILVTERYKQEAIDDATWKDNNSWESLWDTSDYVKANNTYGFNVTVFGKTGGRHTIDTAVFDVPSNIRVLGNKITFAQHDGTWATYQLQSLSLSDYTNPKKWVKLEGITNTGSIVINNQPDEEDITVDNENLLKFADKEFNEDSFSGLGRIYLRKNIIEGKNILTQGMFNKSNTRYIIQYDYDLNNQTISIPKGCIFDFQGGSLKNGTISTTDLDIISSHRTIFFDIEIQGTLNHNLHFVDIWSNKPFLRIFTAISNLVITKDWTLEHTTDWVYHNFQDNPIYIYGNYHTITFDTNNQNSKTTFINSNKVYIENLNIKIEDTSTQEKIATLIDCAQCTLINVYFYGYNRLASNWSRVDINEDTKLYVSNCRLYTTSFIFEHIFSEVEIYDSTIEVLREIRSDYDCKVISCSAYRNDEKSKVIIKNSNILGEWELVYNGDTDFRNGDIYNYKQFDIYNSNLKLFNITYDDNRLIKSSLVANYYNCHITKYMGCNLLNGIKEINHYNCNFIYSPDISIYIIMPFSIISCDTITFFDCNFTLNSNNMPIISFRDASMSNTDATYNFTFVNCNINSTTIINSNFFLINSLSNTNIDEEDVKNFVNICDIKLNYKGDKPQCSLIIRTSTKQYLVPCSNLKLNTYSVTETAFDTMLLENGTDIYLNDRVSTCYKNGVYTKGIITCGPTENRPTYYTRDYEVGFQYFDTTLGKPIWWNNGKWVDSAGANV